nr:cytochrome p450 52a2 [Quercus suber]
MDYLEPLRHKAGHRISLAQIALPLLCLLLYWYWVRSRRAQPSIGVAESHTQGLWWLFGIDSICQDMWDLRNHNSSRRSLLRHQEHGLTYVATLFGVPTIHTIDYRNILAITTHDFETFGKGSWTNLISRVIGKGVLVNDGPEWSASRTNLKPLFKRSRDQDLKMFDVHVRQLIDRLKQHGQSFVDFRQEAQTTVLNITIDMLWGESTPYETTPGQESPSKKKGLLNLIDDLEPYGNLAIELGPFAIPVLAWRVRRVLQLIRGIHGFFHDAIRNAFKDMRTRPSEDSQPSTILHQMLKEGMTHEKAHGELQNIFFAAFDTTTVLLTNLFDCIGRDPRVQQQLRDELDRVVGVEGILTENLLAKLVYLRATVFETLRLHTPVTSHIRKARTDTFLPHGGRGAGGGDERLFVPKGTSVVWSIYALNRQAQTYGAEYMEFRPERWLDQADGKVLANDPSFMPFGSGPRNCLGQQFALLLVSYVTARLLIGVDQIELYQPHLEFEEAAAVTYYNRHGTRLRFCD